MKRINHSLEVGKDYILTDKDGFRQATNTVHFKHCGEYNNKKILFTTQCAANGFESLVTETKHRISSFLDFDYVSHMYNIIGPVDVNLFVG